MWTTRIQLEVTTANPTVRVRLQGLDRILGAVSTEVVRYRMREGRLKMFMPKRLRLYARNHIVYGKPRPPDENMMAELRQRFKPEVVALMAQYLDRDLVSLWGYDHLDWTDRQRVQGPRRSCYVVAAAPAGPRDRRRSMAALGVGSVLSGFPNRVSRLWLRWRPRSSAESSQVHLTTGPWHVEGRSALCLLSRSSWPLYAIALQVLVSYFPAPHRR